MSYATKNHRLLTIMYSCVLALPLFLILSGQSAANATDLDYTINVNSSLNVTMSASDISLALNPASTAFSHQDLSVTVGTNNDAGYNLMVTATGTDLNPTDPKNTDVIETLPALAGDFVNGYTPDNFPANYWGYKKSINGGTATNYLPFESSLELRNTDTKSNSDTTTITFGAKIDYTKPADTYTLALNFAVTANYTGPSSITDLTYMQDFADLDSSQKATILDTMTEGQAYQIKDNRDEEEYKIAKLADGNVWLLDNLRLDPTSVTLAKLQGNTNADDTTLSYLKTSTSSALGPYTKYAVSSSWTSSSQDYYDRPMINTSYKNTTTTSYGNGSGKIGVYYNYCAATAGSYCYDGGSGTGDASQDICPKGWRMPTGSSSGEYQALCNAIKGSDCGSSWSDGTSSSSMRYQLSTPLSGTFYSGSPDDQGTNGRFWSSTRYDGYDMCYLYVGSSTVYPQNRNDRSDGFSVRCLLQ